MTERISALFDGHIDGQEIDAVLGAVRERPEARARWRSYCLIGDALRAEPALQMDLTAVVMERLDDEPTVLAPAVPQRERRPGQGSWHRLLPIAASVVGVAVVGWVALQMNSDDSGPKIVRVVAQAAAPTGAQQASPPARAPMDREAALRAYVFAHQSTATPGAIPGVAPYVRTVSEAAAQGRQ